MEALRWAALVLAVVSLLAFLVLAVVAFDQHVFELDHAAHALVQSARHPLLQSLMRALTGLGSGYALVPLSAGAFVLLRRRRHLLARFVPAMVAGSFVVFALTKWVVARPRPRLSAYGFPSAHTFGAVVFFGGLIYVLWTVEIGRLGRWAATALLALLILGIAYSRLYLRAHWLSDVIGGFAGGTAYLLFFLMAIDRRLRPSG